MPSGPALGGDAECTQGGLARLVCTSRATLGQGRPVFLDLEMVHGRAAPAVDHFGMPKRRAGPPPHHLVLPPGRFGTCSRNFS
jgi:hypothetical protein